MTKSWLTLSFAYRLALPHRPSTLVQSDAKSSAENAQPFISWADKGQNRSKTTWSNASIARADTSIRGADPTESALSP